MRNDGISEFTPSFCPCFPPENRFKKSYASSEITTREPTFDWSLEITCIDPDGVVISGMQDHAFGYN